MNSKFLCYELLKDNCKILCQALSNIDTKLDGNIDRIKHARNTNRSSAEG